MGFRNYTRFALFALTISFSCLQLTYASPLPADSTKILDGNSFGLLAETDTTPKPKEDGWSIGTWLIVIGCALVGLIFLSCLVSYLFCACAKEIICLPITCLTKCLCCCCD